MMRAKVEHKGTRLFVELVTDIETTKFQVHVETGGVIASSGGAVKTREIEMICAALTANGHNGVSALMRARWQNGGGEGTGGRSTLRR